MPKPVVLVIPFLALAALLLLRLGLRAWLRARRLGRVAAATTASELEPLLAVKDDEAREAAAAKLAGLVPSRDLAARVPALPGAGARAVARLLGAKDPALAREMLAAASGAARLPWACAAAESEEGARSLAALASDAGLSSEERGAALDAIERSPRPVVRAALVALLGEGAETTAEALWVLGEAGAADDALLAARHVAASSFPVASTACETVAALLERGTPADGARVREVLARGRARLREMHPPGDNPLADGLVAALEDLEARLPMGGCLEAKS